MGEGVVKLLLFGFLSLSFALAQNSSTNLSKQQNSQEDITQPLPKFENEPYLFALLRRAAK